MTTVGTSISAARCSTLDSRADHQQMVDATIADARSWFAARGVRDDEGNGPGVVEWDPAVRAGVYRPPEARFGARADSIGIGIDPRSRQPLTDSPDVIVHEWAHRIVQHASGGRLETKPTSPDVAVQESLADTFAAAWDSDDWVIGDGLRTPYRNMAAPARLGHPDHASQVPQLRAGFDRRKVSPAEAMPPDWHVVAAVPNRAAAIIGDALGREAMFGIYLEAVRVDLQRGAGPRGLATSVVAATDRLHGADSPESQVVRDAWRAVGLLSGPP